MQQTPNLNLKKPEGTDVVDIADLNENADILDAEVVKLASATAAGRMSAADKTKLNGATSAATASTLVQRDANGRFKVAAPVAADDVARKADVDTALSKAKAALPKASNGYPGAIADGTDANTFDWQVGWYQVGPHMANMPFASGYWFVQCLSDGVGSLTLIAYLSNTKSDYYVRMKIGNWGIWNRLMTAAGGTFTGAVQANVGVYMPNNVAVVGKETGGTDRALIHVSTDNSIRVGAPTNTTIIQSGVAPHWHNGSGLYGLIHTGGGQTIDGSLVTGSFTSNAITSHGYVVTGKSTGTIAGNPTFVPSLRVESSGISNDAFMSFHIPGAYAAHFGLSASDSTLRIGGYSLGNASFRIWDERMLRDNNGTLEFWSGGAWKSVGGIKNVQRGTTICGMGVSSATINPVNMAKSVVHFLSTTSEYNGYEGSFGMSYANISLSSTTSLRIDISSSVSGSTIPISWEVIEYN